MLPIMDAVQIARQRRRLLNKLATERNAPPWVAKMITTTPDAELDGLLDRFGALTPEWAWDRLLQS